MTNSSDRTTWAPSDKRRQPRAPLLVLRASINDGARTFFGYAKNVSRSGLFIATINPRELGSRFEVEIPLPNAMGVHLRCQGEVVWRRNYDPASAYEPGMGMRFIDLDDDSAAQIDKWVEQENHRAG